MDDRIGREETTNRRVGRLEHRTRVKFYIAHNNDARIMNTRVPIRRTEQYYFGDSNAKS